MYTLPCEAGRAVWEAAIVALGFLQLPDARLHGALRRRLGQPRPQGRAGCSGGGVAEAGKPKSTERQALPLSERLPDPEPCLHPQGPCCRGHLAKSGDSPGCGDWGWGAAAQQASAGVEARAAAEHPQGRGPHSKGWPSTNVAVLRVGVWAEGPHTSLRQGARGDLRVHLGHAAGYQAQEPSGHRRRLTAAQGHRSGAWTQGWGPHGKPEDGFGQLFWVQVLASLSAGSLRG